MLYRLILGLALTLTSAHQAYSIELSLTELVDATKKALLVVAKSPLNEELKLEKVILSIKTGITIEAGGKVSFWVFELGADTKSSSVSEVKLALAPPSPEEGTDVSANELVDQLAQTIATTIISSGEAIRSSMLGKPPLELQQLTAKIVFALVNDGEAGLKIGFPPFELGGSATSEASNSHLVEVYFEKN